MKARHRADDDRSAGDEPGTDTAMLLNGISLVGIATLVIAVAADVPALMPIAIVSLVAAVLTNIAAIVRELHDVFDE